MSLPHIIAICGSTKAESTNRALIAAIQSMLRGKAVVEESPGIDTLPHYNPDVDYTNPPAAVVEFRSVLKIADAILICTPEYAMEVPGSLKNALDWTVSSCEFSQKPVALITASSQGYKAHKSLLETLNIIESKIAENTQLLIPFAQTKINKNGSITDANTSAAVNRLVQSLLDII